MPLPDRCSGNTIPSRSARRERKRAAMSSTAASRCGAARFTSARSTHGWWRSMLRPASRCGMSRRPTSPSPTPSRWLRASCAARSSSAIRAPNWACAAMSPLTTPRPASWSGGSTPCRRTLPPAPTTPPAMRSGPGPPARPGPASGGKWAAAAPCGIRWFTTPSSINCSSASATGARGTTAPAATARATTCSSPRSSRSIPIPASTSGIIR